MSQENIADGKLDVSLQHGGLPLITLDLKGVTEDPITVIMVPDDPDCWRVQTWQCESQNRAEELYMILCGMRGNNGMGPIKLQGREVQLIWRSTMGALRAQLTLIENKIRETALAIRDEQRHLAPGEEKTVTFSFSLNHEGVFTFERNLLGAQAPP
jgi:hypothetical protein